MNPSAWDSHSSSRRRLAGLVLGLMFVLPGCSGLSSEYDGIDKRPFGQRFAELRDRIASIPDWMSADWEVRKKQQSLDWARRSKRLAAEWETTRTELGPDFVGDARDHWPGVKDSYGRWLYHLRRDAYYGIGNAWYDIKLLE